METIADSNYGHWTALHLEKISTKQTRVVCRLITVVCTMDMVSTSLHKNYNSARDSVATHIDLDHKLVMTRVSSCHKNMVTPVIMLLVCANLACI